MLMRVLLDAHSTKLVICQIPFVLSTVVVILLAQGNQLPVFPYLHQYLLLSVFLFIAISVDVKSLSHCGFDFSFPND